MFGVSVTDMCFYKLANLLVLVALLVQSNSQESCEEKHKESCSKYFEMADIAGATFTGTIEKRDGQAFTEEYSNSCPDAGTRRYRTFNGTCNHERNLGSSFTPHLSLLPPAYDDGVNSPRQKGVDGYPLPSARDVSSHIHVSRDSFIEYPLTVMQWGQWIDHDIVSTPQSTVNNGTITCCGPNGEDLPAPLDPNCFPVAIPADDNIFPGKCLQFVRSLAATDSEGVQLVPRQQVNAVTTFLDASQVYGSTDEEAASVREPGGYLLRTKNDSFLPESPTPNCIKRNGSQDYCYLSGDRRTNQHPYLNGMHTIWLREHNRIARRFKILKPDTSPEELFQMTRKVISAMQQVMTYNDWLPIILGDDARRFKLTSLYGRSSYNPKLLPGIFKAFAAAAFRFGHTTVPQYFPIGDKVVQLRYLFNRPGYVLDDLDGVMAGMTGVSNVKQSIEAVDKYFVDDITKYLFLNTTTGRGLDLVTTNIQRGRDLGLSPYVKWRSFCGLRALTGFNDTEALGPNVSELGKVYRHVDDIDLYTGMLHEPVDTGIAGPTIRCIIAIQFYILKHADRFFFDNDEKNSRFSDAQLTALRNVKLSQVICQNTFIEKLPRNVYRFPSKNNPLIPCSQLRKESIYLDLFV